MQAPGQPKWTARLPQLLNKLGVGSLLLGLLLIAGALLVGFVRLTWTEHQINQAIVRQQAANAAAQQRNAELSGQADYAESDSAAEQAARERLGMAREGETVVRPNFVTAPTAAPLPSAEPSSTAPSIANPPSSAVVPAPPSRASNAAHWWRALFPGSAARP